MRHKFYALAAVCAAALWGSVTPARAADDAVRQMENKFIEKLPGATDTAPAYVQEWKAFAEASGRPDDKRWVELISDPMAIKLSNAWTAWRGYNGATLVEQARKDGKIPAEIKPGLVITGDNVDSLPIKGLLTQSIIDRLKDKNWQGFKSIRVVPTGSYYLPAGKLQGFLDEKGTFELDQTTGGLRIKNCTTCVKGQTVADDWGQKSLKIPFVPKISTGLEAVWAYALHNVASDNLYFKPIEFVLCDANNKIERTYSSHLWWQNFYGRATYEPTPSFPNGNQNDYQGGAIFFTHPLDVKGLCGARIRHFDPNAQDSFAVFVPFLKRTRILTGSDTQDPLCAGCDLNWDDWRSFWQRIDPRETEYQMEGEGFILAQPERGMVGDGWKLDNCQYSDIDMELRPVYIVHLKDKTGKYVYAERRIWIDKDWWYQQQEQRFDRKGNMWRDWIDARYWDPRTGEAMWRNVIIWDPINHHGTLIRMNVDFEQAMLGTKKEFFDIETLKNYQ